MPGVGAILRILLQIFAGLGVAYAADKFLPNKVKGYEPISPSKTFGRKLLFFVGAMGGGALLWNLANRRFHILTRRHAPRRSRSRRRSRKR